MAKSRVGVFICMALLGIGFLQVRSLGQTKPARRGLQTYQWDKRVLLLFAPVGQDAALREQKHLFEGQEEAFAERDLILLEAVGQQPVKMKGGAETALALRERYRVSATAFTLVLIGKDGGEKYRSAAPVAPEKIYGIIDAMPMRQSEMRKNKQP